MTDQITKVLTTEETYQLVKVLRDTKRAKFEFYGEKNSHITVKWRGMPVFRAINTGNGWIVRHKADLFVPA